MEIASNIQEHVDYFYLREKHMSASELYKAVTLLHEKKIPLSKIIINDRVDVAWVMKVFGVQLAFHSLDVRVVKEAFPGIKVGSSIHSMDEAKAAFSIMEPITRFMDIFLKRIQKSDFLLRELRSFMQSQEVSIFRLLR